MEQCTNLPKRHRYIRCQLAGQLRRLQTKNTLKRELRVPLEHPLLKPRLLALAPQRRPMHNPIEDGAAIRRGDSLARPWDTNKLAFESLRCRAHGCVAMSGD